MRTVNFISHRNGSGLEKDYHILSAIFEQAGYKPRFVEYHTAGKCPGADINVFIELFKPEWISQATKNYIIPNQEWFLARWLPALSAKTTVLAKSRHAERIFSRYCPTQYIGFTSPDLHLPEVKKCRQFIHIRGKSTTKGTAQALRAWRENPSLPTLNIYTHRAWTDKEKAILGGGIDNVKVHAAFIPSDRFREVINRALFHVCPSPCEGFGHYINEARACGGIVITTDAAPMNELIQDGINGFTVPVWMEEACHMDVKSKVSPVDLAITAMRAWNTGENAISRIGRAARVSYEEGKKDFETRIKAIINE